MCGGRQRYIYSVRIPLCFLCFLYALTLTACSSSAPSTSGVQAAAPGGRGGGRGGRTAGEVPVSVATVVERSMPVNLHAVGNVESTSTVEIQSQVTGSLLTVEFEEGQDVNAGDLLFTIDPRPFEVALKQAEAARAKDAGQSKNAEVQRQRYKDLLTRGLIAQSDFDTISAQANALQSTLELDDVLIENARLQLQYTRIHAPIAGRTGALLAHPGSLIRANDTSPMIVINQVAPVYVSFALPARMLSSYRAQQNRAGLRVDAAVGGNPEAASIGTVTFIDNTVDQTTDTIRLKATFPNADHRLWPGQFVEVTLRLSVDEHAIVAPAVAVQPGQQGSYVWVLNADQTVAMRPVTVTRSEGQVAVIGSGLKAGEVVVTDGQLRLTPGAPVSVKTPDTGGSS